MTYPKSENDDERVEVLRSLGILDSSPDENFDRVVRLCRLIFEVPDARVDPIFMNNPLVTGPPYIRYYAGAPIRFDDVKLGAVPHGPAIRRCSTVNDVPKWLISIIQSPLRLWRSVF
jgi:hypothetical protein